MFFFFVLKVEVFFLFLDGILLVIGVRDKDIILFLLDVFLIEVDVFFIEDQNEVVINYGVILWKKYIRKVMQRIFCK